MQVLNPRAACLNLGLVFLTRNQSVYVVGWFMWVEVVGQIKFYRPYMKYMIKPLNKCSQNENKTPKLKEDSIGNTPIETPRGPILKTQINLSF